MARFSKKKVIKKKSVNKNKNTRGRKRVSRGKSRRRVKRKYVGGVDNGNQEGKADPKYYKIEPNPKKDDSTNLFKYIEDLLEVIYLAIVSIFSLCGPIDTEVESAKTEIKSKLGKHPTLTSLVDKLLVSGVTVNYTLATGNAPGGALNGGGDKWKRLKKLLRINVSGASEEHAGNDDSSSSPYIDITLPTLEEMNTTSFDFEIFKAELNIDKINAEINTLISTDTILQNEIRELNIKVLEVSALVTSNHSTTVETNQAILASTMARIEVNRHLLSLYNPAERLTLPTLSDYPHKQLVKQIAIDAVNYNLKTPGSDEVVISEGTKKNEIEIKELTSLFGNIRESRI